MHRPTNSHCATVLGVDLVEAGGRTEMPATRTVVGQHEPTKAIVPAEQDVEPAARRIRDGRVSKALVSIKE